MSKCYVIRKTAEEETNPTSAVFGLFMNLFLYKLNQIESHELAGIIDSDFTPTGVKPELLAKLFFISLNVTHISFSFQWVGSLIVGIIDNFHDFSINILAEMPVTDIRSEIPIAISLISCVFVCWKYIINTFSFVSIAQIYIKCKSHHI